LVAIRRSSAPTTGYSDRPQRAVQGLAVLPSVLFGTDQYSARWHRRTTGSGVCPLIRHEAGGPTNGGPSGECPAHKKPPHPTKHLPAQTAAGHADGQFGFGAERAPPTLA